MVTSGYNFKIFFPLPEEFVVACVVLITEKLKWYLTLSELNNFDSNYVCFLIVSLQVRPTPF